MLVRLFAQVVTYNAYIYQVSIFSSNGALVVGPIQIATAHLYDWLLRSGRRHMAARLVNGYLSIDVLCLTFEDLDLLDERLCLVEAQI